MQRLLRGFGRSQSGSAAIQMAFLMPVLVLGTFGMVDTWSYVSSVINMRAGVNSSAKLVMQGETNVQTLRATALNGWTKPPSDAAATVTSTCSCSGLTVACTSLCSGSKPPSIMISIQASGTWNAPFKAGGLAGPRSMATEQVIRVR